MISPLFLLLSVTRFAISTTMHNTHCPSNNYTENMHSIQYWRLKRVEMFLGPNEELTTVSGRLLIAKASEHQLEHILRLVARWAMCVVHSGAYCKASCRKVTKYKGNTLFFTC
jgi:hypothetical protein